MVIAVVDYGSGNLRSVAKALEHVAVPLGESVAVTDDAACVRAADRVLLPGVGAFRDCKEGLARLPGMLDALSHFALEQRKPFLGICIGMQLLATKGYEHGETEGLGWIPGHVVPLELPDGLKIPHMGWNSLNVLSEAGEHSMLCDVRSGDDVYFVHSYHFVPDDPASVCATVDYGVPIVAAVAVDNIFATQFHPEKSQEVGLQLLKNFVCWEAS